MSILFKWNNNGYYTRRWGDQSVLYCANCRSPLRRKDSSWEHLTCTCCKSICNNPDYVPYKAKKKNQISK